jgi:hypothetical protein
MLERRAAKLFEHLRDALGQGLLAGPLGADYTSVLRTSLLPVPAYCARSSAAVFLGESYARAAGPDAQVWLVLQSTSKCSASQGLSRW